MSQLPPCLTLFFHLACILSIGCFWPTWFHLIAFFFLFVSWIDTANQNVFPWRMIANLRLADATSIKVLECFGQLINRVNAVLDTVLLSWICVTFNVLRAQFSRRLGYRKIGQSRVEDINVSNIHWCQNLIMLLISDW